MPFDPSLPQENTPVDAAQMRGQFTGLKALIDAVSGVTSAVVDAVNTVGPGDPATVSVSVSGTVLHLSFAIPRGSDGLQGLQGPPFASATVDSVSTLNPGENATVSAVFDGISTVHFSFGIPRGTTGAEGIQGPPGEVTNAALAAAVAGSSANTNGVGTLNMAFTNDPPTLADIEVMRAKVNELILALRR